MTRDKLPLLNIVLTQIFSQVLVLYLKQFKQLQKKILENILDSWMKNVNIDLTDALLIFQPV